MSEIESEELVTALEKIVVLFKDDIEPFALQLSQQLVDSYHRMIQVNIKEEEGVSVWVANGCVAAISRIIRSCKKNKDFLVKIEGIVYNMLLHSLTD